MNELSLFTGYGGLSLGLRLAGLDVRTVGYVEIDRYCQEVIRARIRDGFLDWAPIVRDIRTTDFRPMAGLVDIITAGFPCPPFSVAGKRLGAADERNLWPDTLRAIDEVGPAIVLLENVPGLGTANRLSLLVLEALRQRRLPDPDHPEPDAGRIHRRDVQARGDAYMGTVVGQLSAIGYDCRWGIVSAAAVGAPHLRRRWWCLAHATDNRRSGRRGTSQQERQNETVEGAQQPGADGEARYVGHGDGAGLVHTQGVGTDAESPGRHKPCAGSWWDVEPPLGRVADGVANRVAQLRALGNGVVPASVALFLKRISAVV